MSVSSARPNSHLFTGPPPAVLVLLVVLAGLAAAAAALVRRRERAGSGAARFASRAELARTGAALGLSETEAARIVRYPQGVALWRVGSRSYEVRHVRSARERALTATDKAMASRETAPSA